MKIYKHTIKGRTVRLYYNCQAMLTVADRWPDRDVGDILKASTMAEFADFCGIIAILAEQGELYRRALGYDSEKPLTEDELRLLLTPMDVPLLRIAAMNAVVEGMSQNTGEDEEVDVGLMELNKNKKKD